MTALQVDITAVVLSGLRLLLPTPRWVTETPEKLETALPLGRVIRSGGGDDGFILDTATITVECFDAGTESSRQFAYATAGAVRALQGMTINGASVTYVRKIGGPVPLPYANPAVRRQALTFRVAVKTA